MENKLICMEIKNFMRNIRFLRETNKLSKRKMAEILKISVKSLNKIEDGESMPDISVDVVFNIYDYFGILPKDQFSDWTKTENSNL